MHVFLFVRQKWEPAHHIDHTKPFQVFHGMCFSTCTYKNILWHNISSLVLRLISKFSTLCSRNIDFVQVVHTPRYHHIDGISLGYFLIGLFFNTDISLLCWFAQLTMFGNIWMNDIWCIIASICWFIITSVKEAQ